MLAISLITMTYSYFSYAEINLKKDETAHLTGLRNLKTMMLEITYAKENGEIGIGWIQASGRNPSYVEIGPDPEFNDQKKIRFDREVKVYETQNGANEPFPRTVVETAGSIQTKISEIISPPKQQCPPRATAVNPIVQELSPMNTAIKAKREGLCRSGTTATSELPNVDLYQCDNNPQINAFKLAEIHGDDEPGSRDFTFSFPERALSDVSLKTYSSNSSYTKGSSMDTMIFLPRKNVPAIEKKTNGDYEVTLSNGEKVLYDGKTNKMKSGGVLGNNLSYSGAGVSIRAHAASYVVPEASKEALVISKKGQKDCKKIFPKDLWVEKTIPPPPGKQGGLSDYVVRGEFATDEGLDKLIKEKCGFSIF